jgi:hypothetical protein
MLRDDMPASVELKSLNHVVTELQGAVTSLERKYGRIPAVARLVNDLERLRLDVTDVERLPAVAGSAPAIEMLQVSDEPYDPSLWADDADDEGLGGFHGGHHR